MLVIDASVLAVALIDDGLDGDVVRQRLRGEQLAAPSLIDLEVTSVWRGLAPVSYTHLDVYKRQEHSGVGGHRPREGAAHQVLGLFPILDDSHGLGHQLDDADRPVFSAHPPLLP